MSDTTDSNTPDLAGDSGIDSTPAGEQHNTDFEGIAREKGWKPKEEYDGDSEGWIGAEEFVKRQPLFDKIKVQSKKLKELERTVEAMAKHYQVNIQQAKEKAISELKEQRKEAIELGDSAAVDQIDHKIDMVKQTPDPELPAKTLAPEIEQFVDEQRDWFNKDDEMTAFAVSYNEAYLKRHPGSLGDSLKETLKAVKKAFPEKFANQKRTAPPPVESGGAPTGGNSKYSIGRLNKEQKLVYEQLVKVHKQMTHDDYFKSLESAGYLEG